MGNSSSQVAPTQATQATAETQVEAPTPGTKRSAPSPPIELESEHHVKKLKIASPLKPQKRTRAKPQHRRGGFIRPNLQPDPLQQPGEEPRTLQHVEISVVRLQPPEPLKRKLSQGSREQTDPGVMSQADAQLQHEYSAARSASDELQRVVNAENIPPVDDDDEMVPNRKPKRHKTTKAPAKGGDPPSSKRNRNGNALVGGSDAVAGAEDVGAKNIIANQLLVKTTTSNKSPRSKGLKKVQFEEHAEETLTQRQRPHVEQNIPSVDGCGDIRSKQRKRNRRNIADTQQSPALQGAQVERSTGTSVRAPPQTDTIPTPPKSSADKVAVEISRTDSKQQVGHDQTTTGAGPSLTRMSPRNRINNWLESGAFPPPPVQGTISPSPERKRSSARKRVEPAEQQPPNVVENVTQDVGTTADSAAEKTRRSSGRQRQTSDVPNIDRRGADPSINTNHAAADDERVEQVPDDNINWLAPYDDTRPTAMRQYQSAERGTRTGAWSAEEKNLADEVWNNFLKNNNVTDWDLRVATVDWANIGIIKLEMNEAFPRRTIAAIRKYCQRRYTPYKMGPWTDEEDKALRKEYARLPDNWTEIGYNIMRPPHATRDRWRNILEDAESRQKGPWSTDEEDMLMTAVAECVQLIRDGEGMAGKSQAELEESINWKSVSEKMGKTRTAKRCREKWQASKRAPATKVPEPQTRSRSVQPAPAQRDPSGDTDANSMSKKLRRLDYQYEQLKPGDIFDALTDIAEAMKDQLDREFKDESTFWSIVATENRTTSKFVHCPQLRRRAYYGALERWGSKKRKVKHAKGIARKAAELQRRMVKHAEKGKLQFERTYKVDDFPTGRGRADAVDGIPQAGGTAKVKAMAGEQQPTHEEKTVDQPTKEKKRKRRSTSEAYVVDSDVDV